MVQNHKKDLKRVRKTVIIEPQTKRGNKNEGIADKLLPIFLRPCVCGGNGQNNCYCNNDFNGNGSSCGYRSKCAEKK